MKQLAYQERTLSSEATAYVIAGFFAGLAAIKLCRNIHHDHARSRRGRDDGIAAVVAMGLH